MNRSVKHGVKLLSLAAIAMLSSGCSSTKTVSNIDQVVSVEPMYLRGVFNWWEADEKYRLQETEKKVFSTIVNLVADGQPYDFKVADQSWTPGLSCGSLPGQQSVSLNSAKVAFCDGTSENFQFTPDETGDFRFSMDFTHFTPRLLIERMSN